MLWFAFFEFGCSFKGKCDNGGKAILSLGGVFFIKMTNLGGHFDAPVASVGGPGARP